MDLNLEDELDQVFQRIHAANIDSDHPVPPDAQNLQT